MSKRPNLYFSRRRPWNVAISLCIVLLAAVIFFPIAMAENVTVPPASTLFVTIDPIGDHTLGEVFFINGTTNLPVSEKLTLDIDLYDYVYRPHMKYDPHPPNSSAIFSDISIISSETGPNLWSANLTNASSLLNYEKYVVFVSSTNISGISANDFMLLPANIDTSTMVRPIILQSIPQSPSPIQPTTSRVTVLPKKQLSSLPLALTFIVVAAIVIMRSIRGNKRD